jgi:6-phosphogluconolactonase
MTPLFVSMKKLLASLTLVAPFAFFGAAAIAAPPEGNEIAVTLAPHRSEQGHLPSRLDLASGKLSTDLAAETEQPSFLALHPNRRFLYAVNETGEGRRGTGQVTAFAIGADGKLTRLNQQPSRGSAPCHLVVDRAGKTLLLANYGGGSVAAFPIGPDSRLGESSAFVQHSGVSTNPQRQKAPCTFHQSLAANRFAVAADLSLDRYWSAADAVKGRFRRRPPSTSVKASSPATSRSTRRS